MSGELTKLKPSAAVAHAIVFAVYCPPQTPTPGHALHSMPSKSSRDILPALISPTDWNAETMSVSSPFHFPGLIVPAST